MGSQLLCGTDKRAHNSERVKIVQCLSNACQVGQMRVKASNTSSSLLEADSARGTPSELLCLSPSGIGRANPWLALLCLASR